MIGSKTETIVRILQFLPSSDPHFADSIYPMGGEPLRFLSELMGEQVGSDYYDSAVGYIRTTKRDDEKLDDEIKRKIMRYWYD